MMGILRKILEWIEIHFNKTSAAEEKSMGQKISNNGLKFIAKWEGTGPVRDGRYFVYKDVAGLSTVGHGHLLTKDELSSGKITINISSVRYHEGLSKTQVLQLLDQDVDIAEQAVNFHVTTSISQNQFDVLVSFTFNVGVGAFAKSTLLKRLNHNLYDQVPDQLLRWTRAGGRKVKGLVNRRNAEAALWNE